MQELVDIHFPQAAVMSVVLDNLNTHTPAALDAIFAPAEACRMLQKLTAVRLRNESGLEEPCLLVE